MTHINIVIPVLRRPQNAVKVVTSIELTTSFDYSVTFVCSPDDDAQIEACRNTRHTTIVMNTPAGPGDFARKHNEAARLTEGEWLFAGADDLEFMPGWDTEAMRLAELTGASVIGTNDLANPTVMRGDHATHMLFRRTYIEDPGATWHDGPGVVYSEAYDHQWVDAEAVMAAKMRGVWAFAEKSHVKHHHPIFDRTVEMDTTYRKALAKGNEDARVFHQRRTVALRSSQR